MNLLILTSSDAQGDDRYRLCDHRADHIRQILKLEAGDTLDIGLLNGPQGSALIESRTDDEIILRTISMHTIEPSAPTVDLICALPRPQTLKKVLFTCGMMGVRRLDLIRANRVERSYYHSPLLQPENYTPHLIEGLSQGKTTRLPMVNIHERFKPFFEDTFESHYRHASESVTRLLPDRDSTLHLNSLINSGDRHILSIAIGPEGGWVPFEIELMESLGFQRFSLGPWILRVEHAVTATLAQLELARGMP